MMLEADYPEIVSHTREHAAFITRLDTFKKHLKANGQTPGLSFDTQKWLYGWLISHISKQDRPAGTYINAKSRTGCTGGKGQQEAGVLCAVMNHIDIFSRAASTTCGGAKFIR